MMQKGCVIFSIPKSVVRPKMVYVLEDESQKKTATSQSAEVGINPQIALLSCSFGSERHDMSQNFQT